MTNETVWVMIETKEDQTNWESPIARTTATSSGEVAPAD
jgi:hypothetical protein